MNMPLAVTVDELATVPLVAVAVLVGETAQVLAHPATNSDPAVKAVVAQTMAACTVAWSRRTGRPGMTPVEVVDAARAYCTAHPGELAAFDQRQAAWMETGL